MVVQIKNLVPFWCNLLLFYRGRKEDPPFLDSGQFLPIMLGRDDSYFEKDDSFFPLCNHLPDRNAIKRTSPFRRRRRCKLMNELTLVKNCRLGK